jgi:hypothetical protein
MGWQLRLLPVTTATVVVINQLLHHATVLAVEAHMPLGEQVYDIAKSNFCQQARHTAALVNDH